MAITRENYVSSETSEEVAGAFVLKGLPSDEKKRASALQGIGNAAKKRGAKLIRRGSQAFVCTTDDAAEVVKSENAISGRGRKASDKYDDLFA